MSIVSDNIDSNEPFYLRYYSGHSGRYGHEFLEFDIKASADFKSAIVRYANNSNYRKDELIRKEFAISFTTLREIKRIVNTSEVFKENGSKWPKKNRDGKQELEIRKGMDYLYFETAAIGSLSESQKNCEDPEGLRVFYYLVMDLKAIIFSLISINFKIKPIS